MKTRNKAIPAVYLLLEQDNKYLFARRCNTGYEDGKYHVPSGHVEDQELPTEALVREAKEEIGIDISVSDLELVHISYRPRHDPTDNRIDLFFKASHWNGEVRNCEPNKCDDLRWCSLEELPESLTTYVRVAIERSQAGIFFNEFSLDSLKELGYYKL